MGQRIDGERLGQHVHALGQELVLHGGIAGVAGDEQHLETRATLAHRLGQLAAVGARQAHVADQQVEPRQSFLRRHRARRIDRLVDAVAQFVQDLRQHQPDAGFVLHEQDGLALASRRARHGLLARDRRRQRRQVAGQVEVDGRAFAHHRMDAGVAARLAGETIDHRQTQAGALSDRLGGEERVEGLGQGLGRHAGAVVRDAHHHVLAGSDIGVHGRVTRVELTRRRLHADHAAARHRVARVDGQVEQGVLDLVAVGLDGRQSGLQQQFELDVLADAAPEHVLHLGDQAVDLERLQVQGLLARERQQPLDERCGALRRGRGHRDVAGQVGGVPARGDPAVHQLQAGRDGRQQVVEVVRDPARELADRLHLLRLAQLRLRLHQRAGPLLHPLFQGLVEFLDGLLGAMARRLVAGDLHEPLRFTRRRRGQQVHRAINEDALPVLAEVPPLVDRPALRGRQREFHGVDPLAPVLGREDDRGTLSDGLVGAPAEDLVGATRPVRDDPLGVGGEDGVVHGVLDDQAQAGLALRQGIERVAQLGHVVAFDEDARDFAGRVAHGLEDEIEQAPSSARRAVLQMEFHAVTDERLSGTVGLVQEVEEHHPLLVVEHLADGSTDQWTRVGQRFVGCVGQREAMFRTPQHRHEARRLREELAQLLALGLQGQVALGDLPGPLEDQRLLGAQHEVVLGRHHVLQAFQFGHVDRVVDHHLHLAMRVEHGDVRDAPVALLEPPALRRGPRDVEPQQRHGVRHARGEDLLDGGDGLRLGDGVGGERVPGPPPRDAGPLALHRPQVRRVRSRDVERTVEDQVGVGRRIEQRLVVERHGPVEGDCGRNARGVDPALSKRFSYSACSCVVSHPSNAHRQTINRTFDLNQLGRWSAFPILDRGWRLISGVWAPLRPNHRSRPDGACRSGCRGVAIRGAGLARQRSVLVRRTLEKRRSVETLSTLV